MVKLTYSVEIKKDRKKVWDLMFGAKSYNKWAKAFSTGSTYKGNWVQGFEILFIDSKFGGSKARLDEVRPYEEIFATHIAMIKKDGLEDTISHMAKDWIGTTERYIFEEKDGKTKVTIEMDTNEVFVLMFEKGWPKALKNLKRLCEQ